MNTTTRRIFASLSVVLGAIAALSLLGVINPTIEVRAALFVLGAALVGLTAQARRTAKRGL